MKRHISQNFEFKYSKNAVAPGWANFSQIADRTNAIFGEKEDNKKAWNQIGDFQNATLQRISTRINNFQVHRIIVTERGAPPNTTITEDKITFTDPIMFFYRDTTGYGLPAVITDNTGNWTEICKKKCIRSCHDGWYWSTNFKTKNERVMVPAQRIADCMTPSYRSAVPSLSKLLNKFGVQRKTYNAESDDPTRGIHSMGFILGRGTQYSPGWFGAGLASTEKVARLVTDYITFDMTTWWTFKLFTRKT